MEFYVVGDSITPVLCSIFMITSSNGNISELLAIWAGNSLATGELPAQRPVTQNFDGFFDLRLNKRFIE